jgi:HK97 family phage prohead protease
MITKQQTIDAPLAVPGTRRVRFTYSDGTVDRAGDSIDPKGWVLDNYRANPIVLFGHSADIDNVIGRSVNVSTYGNKLSGDIDCATADVNPKADMAYKMVKAGLLSAVSVGFNPIDFEFSTDKDRRGGVNYKKQELIELSVCAVGCNPNALIQARSMGIDISLLDEWLDNSELFEKRHSRKLAAEWDNALSRIHGRI